MEEQTTREPSVSPAPQVIAPTQSAAQGEQPQAPEHAAQPPPLVELPSAVQAMEQPQVAPEPMRVPEPAEQPAPRYTKADLPKLRTRVTELKRTLGALHQQKEQAFAKRKEVDNRISGLARALQEAKGKRDSLTREVQEKKQERRQASRGIQQRVGEVRALSEERQRLLAKHKIRGNPGMLKAEIDALDYKIETQGLVFSKEQELMKIIKEKKKQLVQMNALKGVFERVRQIDAELQQLRAKAEGVHREVQTKAGASQAEHEELVKDAKMLRELRARRKALNAECTKLKAEFATGSAELKPLLDALQRLSAAAEHEHQQRRTAHEQQRKLSLAERGKLVEEKLRKGGKLTTEDLLVLQGTQ